MNHIIIRFSVGVLCLLLLSCDKQNAPETESVEAVTVSSVKSDEALPANEIAETWSRSCALCHVTGVAGAPRIGVVEDWQPRLAKGKDMLMKHTIEGFNNMPPLGYCMSCEERDFVALIDFMSGGSK
jgi:cytochrome c5